MRTQLSMKQRLLVAMTLFGMFFGAGNLIFPVHLGQLAGSRVVYAMIGFIITAVGIPILGVAAIGNTHSDGLQSLSSKIGKGKVSSPKKFSKLLDEWDVVNGSPVSRDCITRVFDRQQARMTAEKESLKMLSLGDRIRYSLAKFFE